MRKNFSLIFLFLLLFSSLNYEFSSGEEHLEPTLKSDVPIAQNHVKIRVMNEGEFISLASSEGWQGDGSESNPYIIEGYIFDFDDIAIYIYDCDLFIVVRDCYFSAITGGIHLRRSSNISIENCEIFGGLQIKECEDISVFTSTLKGGFQIEESINISIDGCHRYDVQDFVSLQNIQNIIISNSIFSNIESISKILQCEKLTIKNCQFNNFEMGLSHVFDTPNTIIQDSTFRNFTRPLFSIAYFNKFILFNNVFENFTNYCIQIRGEQITITNNSFSSTNSGLFLDSAYELEMYDNSFVDSGIYIPSITSNLWNSIIAENNTVNGKPILTIKDTDYDGSNIGQDFGQLMLYNVTNLHIKNNEINTRGNGIIMDNCENVIIDSTSSNNVGIHVLTSDCSQITISNNTVNDPIYYSIGDRGSEELMIENNQVTGGNGIYLNNPYNVHVSDNIISTGNFGITISNSDKTLIEHNTIDACNDGIETYNTMNNSLLENSITDCNDGISSRDDGNLLIKKNIIIDSVTGIISRNTDIKNEIYIVENQIDSSKGDGIVFQSGVVANLYSNEMTYSGLRLTTPDNELLIAQNNTINGKKILYEKDQTNLDISGYDYGQLILLNWTDCKIKNVEMFNISSPIQIFESRELSIENVTIESTIIGIGITDSSGIFIDNTIINEFTKTGINLENIKDFEITNTNIKMGEYGIYGNGLNNGSFKNNNINNAESGLSLIYSVKIIINHCSFINNTFCGLTLFSVNDVYVNRNIFINCSRGLDQRIDFKDSSIIENLFFKSKYYGIYFYKDSSRSGAVVIKNMFFLNNGSKDIFDSRHQQAYCIDDEVIWSQNGTGNYWYDWKYPDNDDNGIVDHIFSIEGGVCNDEYPLTETPIRLLSPPTLNGIITGKGYAEFNWDPNNKDVTGEDTQTIIYRRNGELNFEPIVILDPGIGIYNDTTVINGAVYYYQISSRSMLGESIPSDEIMVYADYLGPELMISNPNDGSYYNSSNISVKWFVQDLFSGIGKVELQIDESIWYDVTDVNIFNITLLNDGPHILKMKAIDRAGNNVSVISSFIVDTTVPDIFISSSNGKNLTNGQDYRIFWTCNDSLSGIRNCYMKIDMDMWKQIDPIGSKLLENLSHGSHIVLFRAKDNVSNERIVEWKFIVDKEVPELDIIKPLDGEYTNKPSLQIEWEHWDNDTGISSIVGYLNGALKWNVSWQTKSYDLTLEEGDNEIEIKAIDGMGNEISKMLNIVLDTISPEIIDYSPVGIGIKTTEKISFTFSELIKIDTVRIECDFQYTSTWIENKLVLTPSNKLELGTNYTLSISASDLAGNEVTLSWTFKTEDKESAENEDDNGTTNFTLIILLSIVSLLILIGILVFVIIKKKNQNSTFENQESEQIDYHENREE